jgi:hypothetical protein
MARDDVEAHTSDDGKLVCANCLTDTTMDDVTEDMLNGWVEREDGIIIRPICDNCGRAWAGARGWLDADNLQEEDQ